MTHQTFTLQTIVRRNKANSNGEIPVYFRIIVDGKPAELATRQYVSPALWSPDKGKMKGNTEAARTTNNYLDSLKTKLRKIFVTLEEKGEGITAEKIKNIYLGKNARQKTLLEVFKYHNEKMEAQVGGDFAEGTFERYKTSAGLLEKFIRHQYDVADMPLDDLDHEFVTNLEFWFKTVRKCNHNTTMKYITNLRKIINLALRNRWMEEDPFGRFKITLREVKREALTMDELERLQQKEFGTNRLDQVRDIFVFCCYTGLAYADVAKLHTSQLSRGIDGKHWIFTERTKTKTASNIPLLSPALALIEKYKEHPQAVNKGLVLPVLTNQKMNAYLKEIADLCGIGKTLTTHLARHTFATTVTLTNGVPIETVSSMLGHKNLKTTQIYAKVVQTKVSMDMEKLENKIGNSIKEVTESKVS